MSKLSVTFVVQGEGRGHMTQALALAGYLRDAGHELTRVLVGRSPFRTTPDYFIRRIGAPVETFEAPTQVPDRSARGVSLPATTRDSLRRLPGFVRAARRIHSVTRRADVVVNFLDLVGGLSRVAFGTSAPAVAVAHNYVFLHPELAGAPGRRHVRTFVMAYTRATALRAASRIALSFGPLPDVPASGLVVSPPLLRPGLDRRTPRDDGYLLAYALNPGYADVLAEWQRSNPAVTVHCYVEGGAESLAAEPGSGFHAHPLDDEGFLRHLEGCRAYVGTAGFESICEAYYLGKPALAVPTDGQYEQLLNAWDAQRAGAARSGGYEDLDTFWSTAPAPPQQRVADFRAWVARAPEVLVRQIERAAASRATR
ncbi:MAG TPA: glycosyltransferase family protein [Longimicrobiales bacterium]|nr:glycosyltransferase family protein [Longimicrobiales bacterium]